MALGAVSFWLPDTIWHAIRKSKFDGQDILAITVLMPLTLLGTYVLLKRLDRNKAVKAVGWPLILGVWLLGGFFIVGGWSFAGGGFAGPDGLSGGMGMLLLSFLPPCMFIISTYDGSLGALVIVSLAALIVWAVTRRQALKVC
jgi:hypothetical protein